MPFAALRMAPGSLGRPCYSILAALEGLRGQFWGSRGSLRRPLLRMRSFFSTIYVKSSCALLRYLVYVFRLPAMQPASQGNAAAPREPDIFIRSWLKLVHVHQGVCFFFAVTGFNFAVMVLILQSA